jgi:protein-disulfide isomerase
MDFIKRNMPVVVIGLVTLGIFAAIIIASQRNPVTSPGLSEISNEELIAPHTFTLGSEDAAVTVVEFSDFQCPACRAFQPVLKSIYDNNSDLVRIAFRHFPLPQHPEARKAAEASQVAGEMGKFWEYIDLLFTFNTELKEEDLIRYAGEVGLNTDEFTSKLQSGNYAQFVNTDLSAASSLKLNSTPSFFLNGKLMKFNTPEDFVDQINKEISRFRTMERPKETVGQSQATGNTGNPETELIMTEEQADETYGTIKIEFNEEGFSPKSTVGYLNQKAIFTNTTNRVMVLEQPAIKYEELGPLTEIQPGASLELRMTKTKQWTYREKESGKAGSIFIYE